MLRHSFVFVILGCVCYFDLMRYTGLVLAGLTTAGTIPDINLVCSEDIVRNAASQDIVLSIYNCVIDASTSPGAQECLAAFIADTATDNEFPITGTCRAAYQDLVNGLYGADKSDCPDVLEAGYGLPATCMDHFIHSIRNFYFATGFYPLTFCTSAEVRAYAGFEAFNAILADSWNSGTDYTTETYWVGNQCDVCYTEFYTDVGSAPSDFGDDGLVDECTNADGPTDACLASTIMIDARSNFVACAGWDVLFEGPVCTPEGVATVQTLIPTPYYTFAQCAYHPATSFCKTIQSYFDAIEADTNSVDCLACYTELRDAINAGVISDEAVPPCPEDVPLGECAVYQNAAIAACEADVFADDCVAYQNEALMAFETCAGTTINTDSSTAAPVTTTPSTTTTTTEAVTSVAETTTKSAIGSMSVARLVVIFAALSLAL